MTPSEITLLILGLLIVIALLLTNAAMRLDRLHRRLDSAKYTMEAQLRERAACAHELVTSGAVALESRLVAQEVTWRNLAKLPPLQWADAESLAQRAAQEVELLTVIAAVMGEPADHLALARAIPADYQDLARADHRAQLAQVFYNDAVDAVLRVRRKWLVRTFRLAGRTPTPLHFVTSKTNLGMIEVPR